MSNAMNVELRQLACVYHKDFRKPQNQAQRGNRASLEASERSSRALSGTYSRHSLVWTPACMYSLATDAFAIRMGLTKDVPASIPTMAWSRFVTISPASLLIAQFSTCVGCARAHHVRNGRLGPTSTSRRSPCPGTPIALLFAIHCHALKIRPKEVIRVSKHRSTSFDLCRDSASNHATVSIPLLAFLYDERKNDLHHPNSRPYKKRHEYPDQQRRQNRSELMDNSPVPPVPFRSPPTAPRHTPSPGDKHLSIHTVIEPRHRCT